MNNSASTRRISSIAIEYNGNDKGTAENVYTNNLLGQTPEEQFAEMRFIAERNPNVKKWALTGYISPPKEAGDRMTNEELKELALKSLKSVGLTENNQVVLDVHNSTKQKHIHFIVNRIDVYGKCTVKSANIGKRFGESVRSVCKEMNLNTDLEIGRVKKQRMLYALENSLKVSKNFEDLVDNMRRRGYRVTLSENVKDGVSGMRIVRLKDINDQTQRQYSAGYKLSEITSKLKIKDIKAIMNENQMKKVPSSFTGKSFEGQPNSNENIKEDTSKNLSKNMGELMQELFKPTYAPADDELLRRKKRKSR